MLLYQDPVQERSQENKGICPGFFVFSDPKLGKAASIMKRIAVLLIAAFTFHILSGDAGRFEFLGKFYKIMVKTGKKSKFI